MFVQLVVRCQLSLCQLCQLSQLRQRFASKVIGQLHDFFVVAYPNVHTVAISARSGKIFPDPCYKFLHGWTRMCKSKFAELSWSWIWLRSVQVLFSVCFFWFQGMHFCKLLAVVVRELKFEVQRPFDGWNVWGHPCTSRQICGRRLSVSLSIYYSRRDVKGKLIPAHNYQLTSSQAISFRYRIMKSLCALLKNRLQPITLNWKVQAIPL
jgi:hypothetical protein